MKLSEIKTLLQGLEQLTFRLQDGTQVPEHFHVTEVGVVHRHFIDCGGKAREEKLVNFQLWNANDYDHRLEPSKLLRIISLCEERLGMDDLDIEVEYQAGTIGRYALEYDGENFLLCSKQTACLAKEACGVTTDEHEPEQTCCTPGGACC